MLSVVCGMVRSGLAPFGQSVFSLSSMLWPECQIFKVPWGYGRSAASFLLQNGGRKVMGEGCSYVSLCHLCTECPPLLYNIYTLWFPTGWLPGRGRFRPRPGPSRKRKSGAERKYSTPPEKSERNTIGPIPRLSPLQKGLCLGIIRLRCSQFDCCAEWSRHSSQARGVVQTPCGLPLNCVSSIILYYVRWKIKWFHILQT